MKKKIWETIDENTHEVPGYKLMDSTHRMKVPGGWIVHHSMVRLSTPGQLDFDSGVMAFVPDAKHEWVLE